MATTTFVDNSTVVNAAWLNDVNDGIYNNLEDRISVFEAGNFTDAEIADVRTRTATLDVGTKVATAIASVVSRQKKLVFPAGIYRSSTTFAFGGNFGQWFEGEGNVVLYCTGSGPVATIDSGSATETGKGYITFKNFILSGNASSTYGLYGRGLLRSCIEKVRVVNVATAGFLFEFAVLSTFKDLVVSAATDTFTTNPTKGLMFDDTSSGLSYGSVANTIINPIMENPISNIGIELISGGSNVIVGGSAESVPYGIVIRADMSNNTVIGTDFEGNSTADFLISGKNNSFHGCNCSSTTSGCGFVGAGAEGNSFYSGYIYRVDLNTTSKSTNFYGVSFNSSGGNGIIGDGVYKAYGCYEVDGTNALVSYVSDVLGLIGSYTGTLTGCTTSPTASITYYVNGNTCTLTVPSLTATSNTTACTITGMPADIRPTSTRYSTGVTSNNTTDVLSRIAVESDGTITLYNDASLTFTNTGTKGIKGATITYNIA